MLYGKNAARNEKDLRQFERRVKDVYGEILTEYPKVPVNLNEVLKRHREGLKNAYLNTCVKEIANLAKVKSI
jgi:hypothetical protein